MERKIKLSLLTVAIIAALSWTLLAVVPFAAADEQVLDTRALATGVVGVTLIRVQERL